MADESGLRNLAGDRCGSGGGGEQCTAIKRVTIINQ